MSHFAGFVVLLAAAACPSTSLRAQPPVIHDGASPPVAAWRTAMEAGDLGALAKMHGPDTTAFPPGQVEVKGAAAIMAGYAELFAHDTVSVTLDEAHWTEVAPLVVSWGRTTLTLHPKDGGPDVVSHTRFTDAAVKIDGGWRYVVDHASKPSP